MSAADLLHRLHDAGLTLEPDGPRVIVRPKSLLTDEQREAIRAQKAELLVLLADRTRHIGTTAVSADQAEALPLKTVVAALASLSNLDGDTPAEPALSGNLAGLLPAAPHSSGATTSAAMVQTRACKGCTHRTAYRTCSEPVAAGLADLWCIAWPPPWHGAACAAWSPKVSNGLIEQEKCNE